jgi:hypothetical protein
MCLVDCDDFCLFPVCCLFLLWCSSATTAYRHPGLIAHTGCLEQTALRPRWLCGRSGGRAASMHPGRVWERSSHAKAICEVVYRNAFPTTARLQRHPQRQGEDHDATAMKTPRKASRTRHQGAWTNTTPDRQLNCGGSAFVGVQGG